MADRQKQYSVKKFINIFTMIFALFRSIPSFVALIKIEAQSAGKSIFALLILYLIAGSLITSTWLCVLAMIFIYLTSLNLGSMLSVLIIIIINLLLLIIITMLVMKSRNNLSFPRSRQVLRDIHKM